MKRNHRPFHFAVLTALLALAAGASAAFAFPGSISPLLPSADFLKQKTGPIVDFWEDSGSASAEAAAAKSPVQDTLALLAASHQAFSRSA
jgi:hypothetical protein